MRHKWVSSNIIQNEKRIQYQAPGCGAFETSITKNIQSAYVYFETSKCGAGKRVGRHQTMRTKESELNG